MDTGPYANPAQAALALRRALAADPGNLVVRLGLMELFRQQGRLEESVGCLRKALVLRPDLAVIHNNLGNALKDQGRLDDAIACYRKAAALQPDYWEAHSNLIMTLHYSERQFDEGLPAAIRSNARRSSVAVCQRCAGSFARHL